MTYRKDLRECLSRTDRALCHSCWAVHGIRSILEETMEVDAGCLVSQLVSQMHSDLFTNIGRDCWDWPLIVDAYYGSLM